MFINSKLVQLIETVTKLNIELDLAKKRISILEATPQPQAPSLSYPIPSEKAQDSFANKNILKVHEMRSRDDRLSDLD